MDYSTLYTQHRPALLKVARRVVKSAEDAEDVVQDAFVSALQSTFRGDSTAYTWLYRIVRNKALDLISRRGLASRYEDWVKTQPEKIDASASTLLETSELREAVRRVLSELSPTHQEAVVLHILEDMAVKDIAAVQKVPPGTIMSRLHWARKHLRKKLNPTYRQPV